LRETNRHLNGFHAFATPFAGSGRATRVLQREGGETSLTPKTIGIAIVEHDGKYLVGTRGPDGPLVGYAEFPGGKCLLDEAPKDCACRECLEETGLSVKPVECLLNVQHTYEHGAVDLHFWRCRPLNTADVAADHRGFRWVAASELAHLRFPAANTRIVEILG
jgi:8-oxo-dGTP diphosphatase